MNQVVLFDLKDINSVVQTDAKIAAKVEAGVLGLLVKDSTGVEGICTDQSGNIYVSDRTKHAIYKIEEGGKITLFAGTPGTSGNNTSLNNVSPFSAKFNTPRGICCDKSGNIYVADTGNNQIRVITNDSVGLIAGNGDGTSGFADGSGAAATFNGPQDVAVDNTGILWVADTGNHSLRRIEGAVVQTFAGSETGDQENVAVTARSIFSSPKTVTVTPKGDILVCDTGNKKIKKVSREGWVYLFSGIGTAGFTLGTPFTSQYNDLRYCDVDKSGNMYVVDEQATRTRLLRIDALGSPKIVADFEGTTGNALVLGVCVSPAQKLFVTISSAAR